MSDKICLITGANSGIGKAAAIQIAQKGYTVIIGCRNKERGFSALNEIKKLSQKDNVELLVMDLSLQRSVIDSTNEFKSRYNRLDVLIHNAADFDISRKNPSFSKENIESIWATNHIGPVLLTECLMNPLEKGDRARILTVSSKGLVMHPFLKIRIKDPEFRNGKFSVDRAYYQSKLAQVMYTYYLADKFKYTDMTANCIRVTNVKVDISRYPGITDTMKKIYEMKSKFAITPEEMAKTYVYLATADEAGSINGKYINEKNELVNSSRYSRDKKSISELMNLSYGYIRDEFKQEIIS